MTREGFPTVAAALGLVLMLAVAMGSRPAGDGATALPLFTLLAISEFGFFVTAIGAVLGVRQVHSAGMSAARAIVALTCALLSIAFVLLGIDLWPL